MGKRARRKCLLVVSALLVFMMSLSITAHAAGKPKLSATKKTLTVGKSYNLTLKNYSKKVSFSSSSKAVVTGKRVNNNTVKLTAKKAGTAKITVKAGSKKYICKITVKDSPKLNKTSLTLTVGKTYDLKVTGTAKTAKWSTSKKSVATISKQSKYVYRVKAKKAGTAYIKVKIGNKTYKCKVIVKAKATVKNPYLDQASMTVYAGGSQASLGVLGTSSTVTWDIENKNIAEICPSQASKQHLWVVGKNAGITNIIAKVDGKTLKCRLTVQKFTNPPKGAACIVEQNGEYTLYISNGDNTFREERVESGGKEWQAGKDLYYNEDEFNLLLLQSNKSSVGYMRGNFIENYTVKLPGERSEYVYAFYELISVRLD